MSCIIYIATISGIDQEMYASAQLDGATKWQQIRYITIPCLRTVIIILGILSLRGIMNSDFGLFWMTTMQLGKGALWNVANTIDTYTFNALMNNGDITGAMCVGLYQSMVGFVLVITVNTIIAKVDPESRLF